MISTETRVIFAEEALATYLQVKGESRDGDASIVDLVTDLLHLAVSEGHDPKAIVRMATMNRDHEHLEDLTSSDV